MYYEVIRWIVLSAWMAFWVIITIITMSRLKKIRDYTAAMYFLFACLSCILSNTYWFVHSLMRPDSRIPFAANEIAEYAIFLLLSSCLIKLFYGRKPRSLPVVNAAVYAAANTVLWIAWTGEYVKDILCGVCFGYFLCIVAAAIDYTNLLTKRQGILIFAASWSVIAFQCITLFTKSSIKIIADTVCYLLMFTVILIWFAIALKQIKDQHSAKSTAAAMGLFAWCEAVMYLSAEPMYIGAMICSAASVVLIMKSLLMKEDKL